MNGLMLHCGASVVPRGELNRPVSVQATRTHNPIRHSILPDMVEAGLAERGYKVSEFHAGLSHKGARSFWFMDIEQMSLYPGESFKVKPGTRSGMRDQFALSIGGRTCWDKVYASGIAAGDHVFACDNLSLFGEFQFRRRHTTFNLRDLPGKVSEVLDRLTSKFDRLIERNNAYMNNQVSRSRAENLIFSAYDAGAVSKSKVADVRKLFIEPTHDFGKGTLWTLKQAFTEVNKGIVYGDHLKRGEKLHEILDQAARLAPIITQQELVIE